MTELPARALIGFKISPVSTQIRLKSAAALAEALITWVNGPSNLTKNSLFIMAC
jgi:hypothetical protein